MDWKWLFTSYEGRINRAKFWAAIGIFVVIGVAGMIIDGVLGTSINMGGGAQIGIVGLIISLATIYFAFAVYAKRWHDRDKSGWWSLIIFVPIIGAIWFLIECGILEGTRGANRFGPDPLG